MKDAQGKLYRVLPKQANTTLAAALKLWLGEKQSWGRIERLVKTRHVLVNGNLCLDGARRLKLTDVIRVLEHPTAPPVSEQDVRVRYLDADVVVVEKPAGMTSVRHREEQGWSERRKQDQPTLEDVLPRIIAKRIAGKQTNRPGRTKPGRGGAQRPQPGRTLRTPPVRPVHRIDRDTSGLMVFARTVPAERILGAQFRQHTTGRRYLAVVPGKVKAQTIESQLVRDRGDGRRGSTEDEGHGKRSVTHIRPVETLDGYTLIECRLETGRTHQIRIHLSELGHPLCGDKVYGRARGKEEHVDRSGAPRLALHACDLAFDHPVSGERIEFHMPLPEDLRRFVDRLRGKPQRDD
ncbi:MAG: RluA family pseudouridine synthase [Planctomycetes bacterium]|nr:RluA family pseudouridine synthase [Planctomycetota bacterium]